MKLLKSQLEKVTKSNGRVMLTGPPGSGKEVAARWIHANSNRAGAPFVTVSSAAIQPDHMEEVLFGRETPERGVEQGLLEQAHGGIIYFDEVADMPLGTQSKILRVLVDQSFTRVGGTDKVRVDLRVISSTTRDLPMKSPRGPFREELYHRLNVVPIEVPPLEDRREDIPRAAQHFIELFNAEQGLPCATGRRRRRDAADDVLARQRAPAAERDRTRADPGRGHRPDRGPRPARASPKAGPRGRRHVAVGLAHDPAAARGAGAVRTHYLMAQINRFGGNISRTASFVGMERSALHRKLKSLGVVTSNKAGARVAQVDE
jgi:two-component system nitrogen regulation response regulator NtrX